MDMDKELIVKTSRFNLLLMYGVGSVEIAFLTWLLWGLYEEDSNSFVFGVLF